MFGFPSGTDFRTLVEQTFLGREIVNNFKVSGSSANNSGQLGIYTPEEANPKPCRKEEVNSRFIPRIPRHIKAECFSTVIIFTFRIVEVYINFRGFIKSGIFEESHDNISGCRNTVGKAEPLPDGIPTIGYIVLTRNKDGLNAVNYARDNTSRKIDNPFLNAR